MEMSALSSGPMMPITTRSMDSLEEPGPGSGQVVDSKPRGHRFRTCDGWTSDRCSRRQFSFAQYAEHPSSNDGSNITESIVDENKLMLE